MSCKNDDAQLFLALQAMQNDPNLSARAAGKIYSVDHQKLSRRRRGMQSRRDIPANSRKLTDLEESVIVQYILDLDSKGFPPRLSRVEDMANRLLAERDAQRVGTRWAHNFVKRHLKLTTRFNRKYDYQRAQCEDPEIIRGWFALVRNTIAKYGILEGDIYNFDETGFIMGVISTVGVHRLLVLDGHDSHHSTDFEVYCKENNIITLCMPPHSSHILQPLDVGCFSPLKTAYGKQIEGMMRASITHITKEDFLPAIFAAHQAAMTSDNIRGGFRGAGLVPLDPEKVISQLDVRLKTPTPSNPRPGSAHTWVSKTPNNPTEAFSQSTLIKNRIARHQNSSPTEILRAVDIFAKGTSKIMHQLALLKSENQSLRAANEALSKRRRAKKQRLRQGGSLSVQDAQDIQGQREVEVQIKEETPAGSGRKPRAETRARRCGNCGEPSHNARTCQIVVETSEEDDSE